MTAGYISALDREITPDRTPINMLQTDVAINAGNSGGPLFDMDGNVIGMTTAKVSGTTESGVSIEGLGFAIPINDVMRVVYDLQRYGRVLGRAYLGVTLPKVTIPVAPARNLAIILEVAAMNNRQKKLGYNTAKEFLKRHDGSLGQDDEGDDPELN